MLLRLSLLYQGDGGGIRADSIASKLVCDRLNTRRVNGLLRIIDSARSAAGALLCSEYHGIYRSPNFSRVESLFPQINTPSFLDHGFLSAVC